MVGCLDCQASGSTGDLAELPITEHARRMIVTCWQLGVLPELAELRLRPWAHMLGFGGHFSTKSRRYSTTLTALRNVRRDWRTTRTLRVLGVKETDVAVLRRSAHDPPDADERADNTLLLLGHWRYAGRGHSPGEALFARTIAAELADNRRLARHALREEQQPWEGAA
jgi:hypothetical protein